MINIIEESVVKAVGAVGAAELFALTPAITETAETFKAPFYPPTPAFPAK